MQVKPDKLLLQAPIWISDLAFVPGSDDTQIVTGTAHNRVQLFDTRASPRAVYSVDAGEYAVNAVSVSPDARLVLAADTTGTIVARDLRTGNVLHRYKGFAGAVRSLECHATLPLLAACGIDRFLRIYDINTRQCLHKVDFYVFYC